MYYLSKIKEIEEEYFKERRNLRRLKDNEIKNLYEEYDNHIKKSYNRVMNDIIRHTKCKNYKSKSTVYHLPVENIVKIPYKYGYRHHDVLEYEKEIINKLIKMYYPVEYEQMEYMDMININMEDYSYRGRNIWFVDYTSEGKVIIPREFNYDDYGYPPLKFLEKVSIDYFTITKDSKYDKIYWHLDQEDYDEMVKRNNKDK